MEYPWREPEAQPHQSVPPFSDISSDSVILCWARALDTRAQLPVDFTVREATLAVKLAQSMGLDAAAIAHLRHGALLHDIGMMQVPDAILRKPCALTPGEWAVVRLHPLFADELLAPATALSTAASVARYHHERWDGAGYPHGLRGDHIPLPARIFSVVNAWATMTVDRPYRRALPPERALAEVKAGAGAAFDPEVVASFVSLLDWRAQAA